MNTERLSQLEATLRAKLFPNGGWTEVEELIEAVRWMRPALNGLLAQFEEACEIASEASTQCDEYFRDKFDWEQRITECRSAVESLRALNPTPPTEATK